MLILIDNFDSFTYNLVHCFQILGIKVEVIRNHAISVSECLNLNPEYIVISPGPGNPASAGISKELIRAAAGKIPLLGVCLGMQAIAEVFGGNVIKAPLPVHGKVSEIVHNQKGVFDGIPQNFLATRYHSLAVEENSLPKFIEITAKTKEGIVMGIKHSSYNLQGVQFHPESVLTICGLALIENFLKNKI